VEVTDHISIVTAHLVLFM